MPIADKSFRDAPHVATSSTNHTQIGKSEAREKSPQGSSEPEHKTSFAGCTVFDVIAGNVDFQTLHN